MRLFNFKKKKKSQEARSNEYGGWGMITLLFLVNKSRTINDVYAGVFSWYKSGHITSGKLRIFLTYGKTFRVQNLHTWPTWRAFFRLPSCCSFHRDDRALVLTSPVMTLLSKFGVLLTSFNTPWTMPMRRVFYPNLVISEPMLLLHFSTDL